MKTLDIKNQPTMGFLRTLSLTLTAIRYRLFGSFVTIAVITVAVAFLMNILSEILIKHAIAHNTNDRLRELRYAEAWASRLSSPPTRGELLVEIAQARKDDPAYGEAQAFGRFSDQAMEQYHDLARQAAQYLQFFDNLDYGRCRQLVHTARGTKIFDHLQDKQASTRFTAKLKQLKSIRLVTSLDQFQRFLTSWPKLQQQTDQIREARSVAVASIQKDQANQPLFERLAVANGKFGHTIRNAGFQLDHAAAERLAHQAEQILDTHLLEETFARPRVHKAICAYLDVLPAELNNPMLWSLLSKRRSAVWYEHQVKDIDLGVECILELAKRKAESAQLVRAEQLGIELGNGVMGLGARMTWLVLVSAVVCVVGITNAMLISVSERFREIATLKCLGALDAFIMLMFVLEACMFGVVGGLVGAALGAVVGLGRMFATFGSLLRGAVPVEQLVIAMATAVGMGVVLAAMAAIYPAFKAARLVPMEAMRIE